MMIRWLLCLLGLGVFGHAESVGMNLQSESIPTLSLSDTLQGGGFRMGRLGPWRYSFSEPREIIDGRSIQSDLTTRFEPSVRLRSLPGWNNHIWMELTFSVDSTLSDRGFYMRYFDHGGARFWLNGRLIGQSGNPSPTADGELLGPFINPDFFPISLREGENHLLVEYSEHTLPHWLQRTQWGTSNISFFSSTTWLDLRRERAFAGGGALMLLSLLILLNLFLWSRFRTDFHAYVILTTMLLLLHAGTQMIDTLLPIRQSYLWFFEPVNAVGFMAAVFFFVMAIRAYFGLTLNRRRMYPLLAAATLVLLVMMFVGRSYLEIAQSVMVLIALVYSAMSFFQARKNAEGKRVLPVAMGLIVTLAAAALYVFVYAVFGYREHWVLLGVIFLAYGSIPVSLTFATVIDYANLFRELENKVAERTKELEASLRYRTRFFENVSHEYRTPLTIAQGLLSRILQQQPKESPLTHKLIPVKRNVDRLSTMVEQVLALSTLDNEKLSLQPEAMIADDVVTICVESFRSMAELKGQDIVFFANAPDILVNVERSKMESVVNNVLSNAIKYNRSRGVTVIRTQAEAQLYEVSIEDNGPGIDESEKERIFERFHRIRQNETEYVEGVGIGLELSRAFARAMGGDVVLDTAYKQGARFVITFPVAGIHTGIGANDSVETMALTDLSEARIGPDPSHTRILVVEDNDDMGFYLSEVLQDVGRVERVQNGQSALDWLRTNTCELIITDLMMPQMDGERFIEALSANDDWKDIPVVVLSAKSLEADRLRLLRYGVVDFITKPFHADELYLRIKNLLEFARNRRQVTIDTSVEPLLDERISGKAAEFIKHHLSDTSLSIDRLSAEFNISRRTLYRQIEAETGMSLAVFIREIRLQQARLLAGSADPITLKELAAKVGYLDAANFRKLYQERFGSHPLDDRTL